MIPPGSRPVAALILAASLGALAFALTAQYVFGLLPCILCLYQRVPYAVVALLAAGALLPRTSPRSRLALIALCGLAFLVDSGIAMYHVGVEHHWWAGTSTCSGDGAGNATLTMTPEQLLAALNKPAEVRCDEPA
ncbi:MAG: disulfide bond formation protein B, partial [Rhodospirillales bacterium]|nr:disulfide bond formation protein B [Rhodospirillales bacterium]